MLRFLLIIILFLFLLVFLIFLRGLSAVAQVWRNVFPRKHGRDSADEQRQSSPSSSSSTRSSSSTGSGTPGAGVTPQVILGEDSTPKSPVVRDMGSVKDVDYEKVGE